MFKRIMIMAGLFSIAQVQSIRPKRDSGIVVAAMAAGVGVGTGLYVSSRESNTAKMQRVASLHEEYYQLVKPLLEHIKSYDDVYGFIAKENVFKRDLDCFAYRLRSSCDEMSARYDSYVKPWNWTIAMKIAYEKIYELHRRFVTDCRLVEEKICDIHKRKKILDASAHSVNLINYYTHLMGAWDERADEKSLVRFVRSICKGSSAYPMCACASKLQEHLSDLDATHDMVPCDYGLIEKMERLLDMIFVSQVYVEERRMKEEQEQRERIAQEAKELQERIAREEKALQERIARAEEAKASAQKSQAWTQQQQVWVQEEQVRVQKEQTRAMADANRIEREKLDREKSDKKH